MGYDLYGVSPRGVDIKDYPLLDKWEGKSFKERDEMPKNDIEEYYDQMHQRDSITGSYFRANVWWWRRLWDFTIQVCDEVMTKDDKSAGDGNDGIEISKETCAKMLPLMKQAIKDKEHEKMEAEVTQSIADVPKDKNGWPKGDENFWAMYPFSAAFFQEFTTFVERSGGFRIS